MIDHARVNSGKNYITNILLVEFFVPTGFELRFPMGSQQSQQQSQRPHQNLTFPG